MKFNEYLLSFNIEIKESNFFDQALTHTSYANERKLKYSYERLEFLGDAVLQKSVSEYLFLNFPNEREGFLTRMRTSLVQKGSLAKIAKQIKLGDFIRLGQGELNHRGFENDTILSDVFESITAAIYLDQGTDVVNKWLSKTLLSSESINSLLTDSKDFKTELQELIQVDNRKELKYQTKPIDLQGSLHKGFISKIIIDGQCYGYGEGINKKYAEQLAAKDALEKFKR